MLSRISSCSRRRCLFHWPVANEETIVVSIQSDPLDNTIDRFYFNGSYPLILNAEIGKKVPAGTL